MSTSEDKKLKAPEKENKLPKKIVANPSSG